jgi:integrase
MTNRHKPLTDIEVKAAKPGTDLRDGGGLFLQVSAKGSKTWVLRYTSPAGDKAGKQREMGLGTYPDLSLTKARAAGIAARGLVNQGQDPIDVRDGARLAAVEAATSKSTALTLGEYADREFLPQVLKGFVNAAHRQQWQATFNTHFAPLRDKKLADVSKRDVLAVLKPLWTDKYVTASRSRERLERLFSHAAQNHAFDGENPALWRHFDQTLFRPNAMKRGHHASIPHADVPAFIAKLRTRQGEAMAALMLEFIALTACRTGDARFAVWSEFDLEKAVWSIPAARMKMRRPHVVPLTPRTVELVQEARSRRVTPVGPDDPVFIGPKGVKPLSEMACLMLMKRMGYGDFTAHGLRATFKGWAMTATEFARELIEEQLAHQLGAVEAAYVRTSAIERRRVMMEAWEAHLDGQTPAGGTVVPFRAVAGGEE